jgi:hypothetical protein
MSNFFAQTEALMHGKSATQSSRIWYSRIPAEKAEFYYPIKFSQVTNLQIQFWFKN